MADTNVSYDDEIDLFALFETLWDGKWKIIGMTFAAALIGIAVSIFKPNAYDVSLPFNSASHSNFTKYASLNLILEENDLEYAVNAENIFDSFVTEFNEYDEMVTVLKKDPYVISVLEEVEPKKTRQALLELAKLFSIEPTASKVISATGVTKVTKAVVTFTWHDADQGKAILGKAVENVLANIRDAMLSDVEILATSIEAKKQRRIRQLSAIIDAIEPTQNDINMPVQPSNESGSKNTTGHVDVKSELASIQSDVSADYLLSKMAVIASDDYKGWITYDLDLADVEPKNKPFLYIALASILGGLTGAIYVLVINAARARKERLAPA